MEITGRLTKDAMVRTTKTGKEVVGFSIAINNSYHKKGDSEVTKLVTYIDCSYWRSSQIADYLTKGTIVLLSGRLNEPRIWQNMEGGQRANISFTINEIKILGGGTRTNINNILDSKSTNSSKEVQIGTTTTEEEADNLPF